LPYFAAQTKGGLPAEGCGCSGQAGCGCDPVDPDIPEPAKAVKHKHAYKKKPTFKTVLTEVKYTEMEKKIEMRPVEETYTKTIMVDEEVEQPRTVMHRMTRTRQVPQIKSRTVMQLQTVCRQVRKDVPVEPTVPCPCQDEAPAGGCACPTVEPKFTVEIVDECDQEEVPRQVEYTEMHAEDYEVQVPTTYMEKVVVQVPKEVEEVRTVQKAFEIEIPVEKIRQEATQVPIPSNEEAFYEHSHAGGEEAHTHGAAVDPKTVSDADPCASHDCPVGKLAFKATDGICYCTVM